MGIKIRTVLRVALALMKPKDAEVHFEHVQFDARNENFFGITNNGVIYSGDLSSNTITMVYNLKSQSTAFSLFKRNDENCALIGLQDASLIHMNIDTREIVGPCQGFGEIVKHISVDPWSNRAITTLPHLAVIWDISSKNLVALHRLTNPVNSTLLKAFYGPNFDTIITCFEDGNVIAWYFPSLEYQAQLNRISADSLAVVQLISVSEDSQMLSLFTSDSKLVLFDLVNYTECQIIDMTHSSPKLKQIEILTLESEGRLRRPIIFLTDAGDLQFFDTDRKKTVAKVSAKSGKYVKVARSNHSTKDSFKPMAAILSDGSLEIMNCKITTSSKNVTRSHIGDKPEDTVPKVTVTSNNAENIAAKARLSPPSPEKMADRHLEKKPTVVRLYEFENLLQKFGEFPEKYRFLIWKHLLELPLNQQAFATLLGRGLHPAYANLESRFPVTEPKLLNVLKVILSAVAHWCPLFAEIDYLPQQLLPFIKVLHESPLTCFEIIMTYLVNWCQDWYQLYPAPPYQLLAQIDGILEKSSPKLFSHFKTQGITVQTYAWPLLQSSLSDVFARDEWLQIWDHIIAARQPQFLQSVVAAYTLASQSTLLRCTSSEEFQKYYQDMNPVPVKMVLEKAKQIHSIYTSQPRKSTYKQYQLIPLTKDTYPIFSNFQLAAVENHAYQMNKIRKMEAEYLQQRKAVLYLEAEFGSFHEQEEEWKRREAILKATDYLQKQDVLIEEHRLQEQRLRLQAQKRELCSKELVILEAKKRQLQHDYQLRSEEKISRLQETARWMAVLRQTESEEVNEDAETRYIQQQSEKCRYEMDLLQEHLARNELNYNFSKFPKTQKSQLENPVPKPGGRIQNFECPSMLSSSGSLNSREGTNATIRSEHRSLEEQLMKLEENNRNMEMEIKNVLQQLELEDS